MVCSFIFQKIVGSNDGHSQVVQDKGRKGMMLEAFLELKPAKIAKLTKAEVAALRLYTSSTFRLINGPLRAKVDKPPLALTTLLISDALKKLRAVHMTKTKFQTQYLWRGMKDRVVSEEFFLLGGTELACMSTSSDLDVVAAYADSATPLLFRIKVHPLHRCSTVQRGGGASGGTLSVSHRHTHPLNPSPVLSTPSPKQPAPDKETNKSQLNTGGH